MTLKLATTLDAPESATTPCLVVGFYEGHELSPAAARVDEKSGGAIKRLIESGDATGKAGSSTLLFGVANVTATRVLVIGLGEKKKFDSAAFHRAAGDPGGLHHGLR